MTIAEPIINQRAQAREALRIARDDQRADREEQKAARYVDSMLKRGVPVVRESIPNLEVAESRAHAADERVVEPEVAIADMDREQAEKEPRSSSRRRCSLEVDWSEDETRVRARIAHPPRQPAR